ncbi:MAG: hypothetical protein OCD01_03785 [Fibrobacterales bacterium]
MNSTYIRRLMDLGPARFILPVFPLIILGIFFVMAHTSDTAPIDPLGYLIFLLFSLIMGGAPGALLLFDLYGRQRVTCINGVITARKKLIGIPLSTKSYTLNEFWGVAVKKSERSSTQKRSKDGTVHTVTKYKSTYSIKHAHSANDDLELLIEQNDPDDTLLNEISKELTLPVIDWKETPSTQNIEPKSCYFPQSTFTKTTTSDTITLTNHYWKRIHIFFIAFAAAFLLGSFIAGPIAIIFSALPLTGLLYLKRYQLQLTLSSTDISGHSLLSPLTQYKYTIPYRDILGVSVEGIESEKSAKHVVLRVTTRDTTNDTLPAGPKVFAPIRSALLFNRHDGEWIKAVIVAHMKSPLRNAPQSERAPSISELFSEAT